MGDVSDKNDPSRPSLDTEAISGDDEVETFEEVKLDYAMLSKDVLNPPTIPKTLHSDTIDQVIAALTNVPDVHIGAGSPRKPSSSAQQSASTSSGHHQDSRRHKRSRSHREEVSSDDEDDRYKRRRDSHEDEEENVQYVKKIPISAIRGRGRGRLRMRARGRGRGFLQEQARGLFAPRVARAKQIRDREREREHYTSHSQPVSVQRGSFPVARGRNIFPEDENGGGFSRGRGVQRENALFKRFKQQHRFEEEKEEEDYYSSRKTRSRSRSRSKSRSESSSNSSERSTSSEDSDSDDSPRKKKKKKEKRKKKKHKKDKKKKKIKEEKASSEEKDGDWRIQLLQKMKNIKNLPPEQLEVEFKKAMAEKKRKEEEEKCLEQIKIRQKLARKVKKESEKAAKKAADEKKNKRDSEENFYAGYNEVAIKMEEGEKPRPEEEEAEDAPTTYPAIFKPSFAEVPFKEESGDPMDTPMPEGSDDQFIPRANMPQPEEDDPYARAFEENMNRSRKSEPKDVSWPAGALEETGLEDTQLTKEQMDMLQDQQRLAMDDKSKNVVSASKMFSKIRNRIKSKGPMKINLKTHSMNEDPGLEGAAGDNTPGEGLSEGENWPEDDQDSNQYLMSAENEDLNLARRMERMRRKKEAHDPGELEDGEHSPSPEPVRPHQRRKRMQKPETRDSTPLMDEEKPPVEEREEGEIDPDAPTTSGPSGIVASNWPPNKPPPAPVGPAVSFIDTSVPPPSFLGGGPPPRGPPGPRHMPPRSMVVYPPRPLMSSNIPPPGRLPPPVRPGQQRPPVGGEPFPPNSHIPPPLMPPGGMTSIPPPVSSVHPMGVHHPTPPPTHVPPPLSDPFVSSSKDAYPRRSSEPESRYGPRKYDEYDQRRDDRYDRRDDDRYDRHRDRERDRYDRRDRDERGRRDFDDRGRKSRDDRSRRSKDDEYSRYQSDNKVYGGEDISEDEEGLDDGGFDINKNITPIMKYIAKHLEEKRHTLELRGPFRYNDNMPGLSKHLFVSHTLVNLLEKAGYDQSKMYMQAMFPNGMNEVKDEMLDLASKGKLHPEIHGTKLVRMVSRCIKCYVAYFSGKKEDLASSSEEEEEDSGGRETRTVNTSLSAILGMIKDDAANESRAARESEERNPMSQIPDTIGNNPWGNMDTKIKAERLKSFSQLQNHFTKQLMGRGVHQRDARGESADCMMCLVVTGWSDEMLKDMVSRFKRTILPEQSQLDEKRTGANRTLFDQMIDLMNRHKQQFPASILEAAQRDDNPEEAIKKRIKNIVERMLKFYMKGCGKLQEGREATASQPPIAPEDYQLDYVPEDLREDEKSEGGAGKGSGASSNPNNFFNMDAAAMANRSFSSYNNIKRMSLDEDDQADLDLEPVSPDYNGEMVKGGLSKQKYLIGALSIDTLQFKGVSYVYEICVHMSDTSSLEVFVLPTNLKNDKTVLEMLGFSYNPEDKRFMYVKPGGGMSKVYGEKQALEKLVQFLQEKRYESRGESKNSGLVLVTQTTGELATWERFTRFYKLDMEVEGFVAGYGVLDYFVEDSGGMYSYVGPKMNRESDKTFFTWEYSAQGRHSENMASTRASAVLILLEDLLGAAPDYENFIKHNCFKNDETRMKEVHRKEDIIKDLYPLECQLCDALNERTQRKKIFTGGIFSPCTTSDWGDKAGFVAAKFIRFLVESGLSKPALKDKAVHAREKGIPFQVNLDNIINRMKKEEEKERCRQQIDNLVRVTQDFILTK